MSAARRLRFMTWCSLALYLGACAEQLAPGASWVHQAQAAHLEADQAVVAEEWERARGALRGALAMPVPRGVDAADARVVKQDLLFRLSAVELSAGDAVAAADRADEGLNLGRAQDVFTANLLVARGRALEALGRAREATGDYFDALEIHDALLDRALAGEEIP